MRILVPILCLSLAGCVTATTGTTVQDTRAFVPGQTTQDEITAKLGAPQKIMNNPNGTRTLVYVSTQREASDNYFVPFANYVQGSMKDNIKSVSFEIDSNGALKSISNSEQRICSKDGYIGYLNGGMRAENCTQ